MPLPDDIRYAFPTGKFAPPAELAAVGAVEAELGVALPSPLRAIYLAFDGFREPLGNAAYVWPLVGPDGSLLGMTQFMWKQSAAGVFPDLRDCVFFGSSSADENWGMRVRPPHQLIAYHHQMEDEHDELGDDVLAVLLADQGKYGEVAG